MNSFIMRIILSTTLLLAFALSSAHAASERGLDIKSKEELSHKSGKLGAFRALVIGINNYQDKKIPALKTAVNDAKEFAKLLQARYGFQVTLLLDRQATRQAIMDKMRYLVASTSPDESVLIYYAGHGDLDRVLNDGWWVPADAIGGNPATYLDNNYVHRVMKNMNARHVLLVSDSCYSGTLFGESRSLPAIIDDRYYLNLYNEKSRWGITSGNKTPVSDSGSEGHSIFAYQLIKTLENNEKPYITPQEIYNQIAPIIANNSEQQPLCSPVRDTGDQGGGFVFVAATPPPSYLKKSVPQPESDDLRLLRESLEREKQELERMKALYLEREKLAAERRRLEAENQQLVMGPLPSSVETKAKAEAEEIARAKAKAEAQAIAKAELEIVRAESIAKAKAEAEAIAKAEQIAKAKAEAEEIARAKAKAEEIERTKAEQVAKAEEIAKAKFEADELARQKAALEREKQEMAREKQEMERQKALDAEREQLAAERHKLEAENQQLLTSAIDPAIVSLKIVARDGRFEKLSSGVVRDTKSGLEWYAGPDKNTDFDDAKSWVANLRVDVGSWRMPTITELKSLYQKGAGSRNMTMLLETTGWWVWSVQTGGKTQAVSLDFSDGSELLDYRYGASYYKRVFAVRSR